MTHQLRCGPTAPSTLRGSWSSVRRAANWQALPVRWHSVPHRGYPTPMNGRELCARPRFQSHAMGHPPCATPSGSSGAWGLTPQPGFPDTPCLFTGLSAAPVGRTATGFCVSPITGGGGRWRYPIPYPTFGTRSQSASSLTCPGRPTINPWSPPQVFSDRDRATVSQRSRSPLSAAPAPIS